ncbi:MAG: hypothetical protein HFH95_01255 [Lachnospiraceae bacterium]|nr:hypothetical protein [Lachnospiraceae bacterium]
MENLFAKRKGKRTNKTQINSKKSLHIPKGKCKIKSRPPEKSELAAEEYGISERMNCMTDGSGMTHRECSE